jgi:hypothetical protein
MKPDNPASSLGAQEKSTASIVPREEEFQASRSRLAEVRHRLDPMFMVA